MNDTDATLGEVTHTRVYDAPRDLVFRCMVTPDHLTHFWGPIGVSTPLENITALTFTDLGNGTTEVVAHQTNVPEMYRTPESPAGMQSSFDRFAAYVAGR